MNGILYNESVGDGMTAILDQLIPSKEALAETYRRVRSAGEYQWSRAAYSTAETEPVLHLQEEVRLWILAQNGLIQASHKGKLLSGRCRHTAESGSTSWNRSLTTGF